MLGIAACSFGTFAGMAAYAVASYPSAIWAWSLLVLLLIPSVATGVPWIARTHRTPDRLPASLDDKMWQAVLAVILACFGAGFWALLDGDPDTSVWSAALAFAVGCVVTALVARHLRKPVRPPEPRRTPDDWKQGPDGWHLPNPPPPESGGP